MIDIYAISMRLYEYFNQVEKEGIDFEDFIWSMGKKLTDFTVLLLSKV